MSVRLAGDAILGRTLRGTDLPPTDPRSDDELVAAANAGDSAAFEALYYRYRDWAVALAWRFVGDRDEALDVAQDAFLYLLRKFPGFRLTARMTTFLYPVVKNLALQQRRKAARYRLDPDVDEADPRTFVPHADESQQRSELAAVMATLPEPQREAVLMRFVDDMSLAEIAAALSIPVGTVKSRLHNALAALRRDPRTRAFFDFV